MGTAGNQALQEKRGSARKVKARFACNSGSVRQICSDGLRALRDIWAVHA